MRYMGSKGRIAKHILPIILKDRKPDQWYVEPFCGGCNTLDKVDGPRIGADIHQELIAYFTALVNGWLPPKYINEDDYKLVKKHGSPELRGYVGFTLSFGGIFFSSQARSLKIKGSYESLETLNRQGYANAVRQQKDLQGVIFKNCNYYDLRMPEKSIVYCDPPYAGTTGYSKGNFNHNQFYDWLRLQRAKGHLIFISEYNMPKDFRCVWQKTIANNLNAVQGKGKTVIEKLFTL